MRVAAELLVTILCLEVTGTVAALPEAVIAFAVVMTWENVCVPVNVCAASVRAMVAEVEGNVIVVESVPSRVIDLLTVRVFDAAPNARVPSFVATVRLFVRVRLLPSVPARVRELLAVRVFPLAMVRVPVVLVIVRPL